MPVGLSFQDGSGVATTDLANVKIVILEDGAGNKYSLDASSAALKLEYEPSGGGTKVEHTIDGLASALSSLLNVAADPAKPKETVLAAKVAEQAVVDILVPALATVGTDDTKKVYTQFEAKEAFATKTELGNKADSSALNGKANALDVYTKTEANSQFATKNDVTVDSLITTLTTVGADGDKKVYTQSAANTAFATKNDVTVDSLIATLTAGADDTKKVYTQSAANTAFAAKGDLEPGSLKAKVAHAEVIAELGKTFAAKDHTHPALSPGQSANPAPLPQPASPAPMQLDLSSLQGLASDAPLPGDLINI